MTIQQYAKRIEEISLNHHEIKSFHVGNSWDMSASKSSDVYPNVWLEFPVLIDYSRQEKTFTFSIDVLALAKQDDKQDELLRISECETIADQLMQAYQAYIKGMTTISMTGLTVRQINADLAVGCRIDMKISTNRECDFLNHFKETMEKL